MTLLADRELQVLFERVQKLLPLESTDLRQANVPSTPLDLDATVGQTALANDPEILVRFAR